MPDKKRKRLFYILMALAFISVTIYEFLTPTMSDDISYGDTVAEAKNVFDLFAQEAEHYLYHTGRNVAHIILRFFLYTGHKAIFNVVAGIVFTLQSLLIYVNVDHRKKYDVRIYGLILCFLWLFDPAISNTVFWETGACNYLFTTTIILGFITYFRMNAQKNSNSSLGLAIKMFVLGLLAGWCNENTSGGAILFVLLILVYEYFNNNKSFAFIRNWKITALLGSICGFVIMILSPGNFGRAEVTEEEHTGLMAILARFLKITINIKDNYFVLLGFLLVLFVYIAYISVDKRKFMETTAYMRLLSVVALATAYSLIAVPSSQLRTYYGAGIFLMMAVLNGIAYVGNSVNLIGAGTGEGGKGTADAILQTTITAAAMIMGVFLAFTYIEQGANLARIYREFRERDNYLQQQADNGAEDVLAPMLRPQWENRFTMAYVSDIQEDYEFWINDFYAHHYKLDTVSGVPRDSWTEY